MKRIGAGGSVALVAVAIGAAGCVSRTPADPARLTRSPPPPPADVWPERPAETEPLVVRSGHEFVTLVDHGRRGEGRLYEMCWHEAAGGPGAPRTGHASFGTAERGWLHTDWNVARGASPATHTSSRFFLFSSPARRYAMTFARDDGTTEIMEFALRDPDPSLLSVIEPDTGAARGTVLFLASLAGLTPGESAVIDELTARGWLVVWASPSLARMHDPIRVHDKEGPMVEIASAFSRGIDENLAQRAYAMEAVLSFLREGHSELSDRPTVLIGCSAGAINAPTVAARLQGEVDAAVLVAGGADVFGIVTTSTLVKSRIQVDRHLAQPMTRAQNEILRREILAGAALDPYHTAPLLRGIPVLVVQASFDAVVPTRYGALLYERLGRPERWTYPLGHVGLLTWLPTQAPAIADWIERAIASPPDRSPAGNEP